MHLSEPEIEAGKHGIRLEISGERPIPAVYRRASGLLHAVSRRRISGEDASVPGQNVDLMRKECWVVLERALSLRGKES